MKLIAIIKYFFAICRKICAQFDSDSKDIKSRSSANLVENVLANSLVEEKLDWCFFLETLFFISLEIGAEGGLCRWEHEMHFSIVVKEDR